MDAPSEPVARPEPRLDAAGCLLDSTPCRHCGYELRGLAPAAVCPECATAVELSLRGDLLRDADPAWLERLARGMRLFALAIVIGLVWNLGGTVAFVVVLVATRGLPPTIALTLFVVASAAILALQVAAYWLVTTPDPAKAPTESPWSARSIARWGLIISSFVRGAMLVRDVSVMPGATLSGGLPMAPTSGVVIALQHAFGVVGIVALAALFLTAAAIARRMPRPDLAKRTRTIMIGSVICSAVMQVGVLFSQLGAIVATTAAAGGAGAMPGPLTLIGGCLMVPVALAGLGFLIAGIVLVFRYRDALLAIAIEARSDAASPPPPEPAP